MSPPIRALLIFSLGHGNVEQRCLLLGERDQLRAAEDLPLTAQRLLSSTLLRTPT